MDDVPETELFSAYLDGELTADEQVRVEQILAASAEARQLLEELRTLGSTLQGLPQEKLGEDLSARVLQLAERRMLLPDASGNKPCAGRAAEAVKGRAADSADGLEISWRGMLSKRALIWTGVVVATAIIISLNSPPPPKPNRDLAALDKPPAAAAPATAGKEPSKHSTSDGSWDVLANQPRKLQTDDRLAKDESRKAADTKDRAAENDRPKDEIALAWRQANHDKVAKKESESSARPMAKAGPVEVAKKEAESPVLAAAKAAPLEVAKNVAQNQLMNGTGFAPSNANSSPAAATVAGNVYTGGTTITASRKAPAATVVRLDVLPLAVQNKVFENLLADNGLGGDQDSAKVAQKTSAGNFMRRSVQMERGGQSGGQNLNRQQNLADNRGMELRASQMAPSRSASSGSLTQQPWSQPPTYEYEFDASPAQIAKVIAQVRVKSDSFSVAEIEPAASASPAANSFAENRDYAVTEFSGGTGGETLANRPDQQQQTKALAGTANLYREETVQSRSSQAFAAGRSAKQTASPATEAAKQHVLFILKVVDRLPSAASRDSQAPAASAPVKQ